MSEVKSLPLREEVPKELTWDLSVIYENDEKWEEDFKSTQEKIGELKELKGTLGDEQNHFLMLSSQYLTYQEKSVLSMYMLI